MSARLFSQIEPLEARIAPAIVITNPLPDIVAGAGKTGATIDLGKLTTAALPSAYHTKVQFTTNYDIDPNTAGLQPGIITIELYDDTAPLSVQNFLAYVTNASTAGDYDNTVVHRSFDFGTGSGTGNDIIQGGGFDFSKPSAHVTTGPEVHNEYSSKRPNVRGSIAMAKTGESPNTGTSEWFFNVNDNSTILGANNNGGFTVFGQVVAGMSVVDAIAGLTTYDLTNILGSVYSDIPLKNYTSGVPTADQAIRIVDATVLPATPGNSTGLTYTIQHIYQAGTTTPSSLLTGKITDSTLNLKYTAGKSGLADVVVKVSNGTDSATDTFRVDVRPNLILHHSDFQPLIPGDATPLTFEILNSGAALVQGSVKINLSMIKVGDATNTVIQLGSQVVPVKIAGGAAQVVTVKAAVPPKAATTANESYRVIAQIVPLATERFNDDNAATSASRFDTASQSNFQINGTHALVNQFGSFGDRTNVVLKYKSTGDSLITWTMTGAGAGVLIPDGAGHLSLEAQDTSLASTVAVTSSKATTRVALRGIQFDGVIGTAKLGIVDLSGLLVASGGFKALTLGDLSGESRMIIDPVPPDNAVKATISLRTVSNFSIESWMPLASLSVASWNDTAGSVTDSITAPSLGSLKVAGDFAADVTLTGNVPTTAITVTGQMVNSTFKTAGNIGAVRVGAFSSSNIFAGVDSRPLSLDDFTEARTIQSFTITGAGTAGVFTNSQVAAQTIGSIKVKGVATGGAGLKGDIGFIADVIRSYSRAGGPTKTNVTGPERFDDLGDYVVEAL